LEGANYLTTTPKACWVKNTTSARHSCS